MVSAGPEGAFTFMFSAVSAIVVIGAWIILASSRFIQGGVVERPERVPQLYGYTVCLIALVWALASVISLVGASLTLADPEYDDSPDWSGWEPSVTSFEAFRATYDRSREMRAGTDAPAPAPVAEPELRRRYEALRADRRVRAAARARRELVSSTLSIVLAAALFAWHWRWLRRRVGPAGTSPALTV